MKVPVARQSIDWNAWRWPLAIFILALIVLLSITWGVFEAMPHLEDEFANYFQAQAFASGKLAAPSPAYPQSFLVPFAIDLNGQRFSKYPPGFAAVLALGILANAHWLVNPLIGALTLVIVYALGREVFDAATGLLAALLGLLSPMFLGLSSTLLPHSLCAFCLLTFTWACCRIFNAERQATNYHHAFALVGGIMLGWAALTRPYSALVYAAPFGLLAVWQIVQTRRWGLLGTLALMGLAAGGIAALLPLYNHALTGQYRIELYTLVWPYDRIGFGPGYGVLPGGHTLEIAWRDAGADLQDLATVLLGWPFLSWLPPLFGLALPPRRPIDWMLLAPFIAIVIAHGAYWIQGSGIYGPRYYYEALPLLWLLAARGLLKLWNQNTLSRDNIRPVMMMALAALIVLNVFGVLPMRFNLWRGLYGITREPRRQIEQLDIHNALIFVNIHHWGDYSELAWTNNLTLDSDIVFALDEWPTVNQAVIDRYPGRRVFYLDKNVLTERK